MRRFGLLLCGLVTLAVGLSAQSHRLIPLEDPVYDLIQRLQRHGHLLDLHPTALPYTQGEVVAALETLDRANLNATERRWTDIVQQSVRTITPEADQQIVGIWAQAGLDLIDSRRLDPLRPDDDQLHAYSNGALQLYLETGRFVAAMAGRHSFYYDQDPDGLDAAKRIYTRTENSYLGYDGRRFGLYLGSFGNQWGVYGESAALVGLNPRHYDQFNLRLGGSRLSFRAIFGELDSAELDGTFNGMAGDRSTGDQVLGDLRGSLRRYLAIHRIDWRPSRRFNLSVFEATLFSGENTGFSLKYLNPLTNVLLGTDNHPKNEEQNGLFGGLLWLYLDRLTLHGQLMLDDFDIINGEEPPGLALMGSVHYAGWSQVDLTAALDVVGARAYKAEQLEGGYLYLLRGLAVQFSDYVHARVAADVYADALLPGLRLSPQLHLLLQGEQQLINQLLPDNDAPFILVGTVERTVRAALSLAYRASPYWWVRVDAGFNAMDNVGFVEGQSRSRFVGQLSFGLQLPYAYASRLGF